MPVLFAVPVLQLRHTAPSFKQIHEGLGRSLGASINCLDQGFDIWVVVAEGRTAALVRHAESVRTLCARRFGELAFA